MNALGFIVNIVIFLAVMPVAVYLFIKLSVAIAEKLSKNWKWDGKSYADDDWDWENWGKHEEVIPWYLDTKYSGISGNIFYTDDDE